jgi:hypothetical protein
MKARRGIPGEQMESTGSILTIWPGVYQCRRAWGSASVLPPNERRGLELELTELPGQIAGYRRDLGETPAQDKTRREMLEWQIRRDRKLLAEIAARLPRGRLSPGSAPHRSLVISVHFCPLWSISFHMFPRLSNAYKTVTVVSLAVPGCM